MPAQTRPGRECGSCGAAMGPQDRFCPGCGASVGGAGAPAARVPGVATKKCPWCFEQISATARFCDVCNTNLDQPFGAGASGPRMAPRVSGGAGGGGRGFPVVPIVLGGIVIALGIVGVFAKGGSGRQRAIAREKACYANMRVLQAATEMYNMDNKVVLKRVDISRLQRGGYLKVPPVCPETGNRYESSGDLSQSGHIRCVGRSGHGSVD